MSKSTTKLAIAFAFKELLLEKPLNKITINDIAEKCEMNRQTFYYHFHDILDGAHRMDLRIGCRKSIKRKSYICNLAGRLFVYIQHDKKRQEFYYKYLPQCAE